MILNFAISTDVGIEMMSYALDQISLPLDNELSFSNDQSMETIGIIPSNKSLNVQLRIGIEFDDTLRR